LIDLIKPTTVLAGAIAIYENVWDGLAEDLIKIDKIPSDQESQISFFKAKVVGEEEQSKEGIEKFRTNYSLCLNKASEKDSELKIINDKFNLMVRERLYSYRLMFDINEKFFCTEGNSILKYTNSQYFNSHYDGDTSSKRVVSPILYLNEDYEGGEIEFVNFDIKIKPKAGSLMIFPSNYAYRHIAHPVTSGTKYAIVTWIHDRQQ